MKQERTLCIMTALLSASAALITGLASAEMSTKRKNNLTVQAQKLDTNDDGAISLDELTARQNRRFDRLDCDKDGMIEKREYSARMIAMFHRMDRNGDGMLRGDELPGQRFGGKKNQHGGISRDSAKNSCFVS